jgi:pyruvate dehydrogenase E1 component beta subunit
MTYREALRTALIEAMDRDGRVLLLGEDIGVYGGTFRITEGLLHRYGAHRVVDTPISELGFVGAAIGMAMLGLRPVVEVMTWNFALGAADQIIQNAAKVRYFSGGQLEVPLVIRGPSGAGVQLSAQHSQAFESFYGHFPGLVVVSPGTPAEAYGMLRAAIQTPDPVLVLESAALYGAKGPVAPGDAPGLLPGAVRRRPGRDVTLVAYGRLLPAALRAAQRLAEEEIECEVIALRSFRPLDLDAVAASVRRTHRAVVVQEQWPRYGVASEVAAQIYERCFDHLDAPVERVTGADVPMPYAAALEARAMPDETAIVEAVRRSVA